MKKVIKTQDCVFVIHYNVSTRNVRLCEYRRENPMCFDVYEGYAEEPLDMFFQSDKDLLSDAVYYTSSDSGRRKYLKRSVFFGKDGRNLTSYWKL